MADDKGDDKTNAYVPASNAGTFFETTTIHGISPIFTSKSCLQRLFWACLFTLAFGLLTYQIVELMLKVRGNDITIKTTSVSMKELEFPRITICNVNPYSKTRMEKYLSSALNHSFANLTENSNQFLLSKVLGELTRDQMMHFGSDYRDFATMKLNSCIFGGRPCDPSLVSQSYGMMTGNCVGFNHGGVLKQIKPGPEYGLSMILNVNEDDYMPLDVFENSGSGVLVKIARDDLPTEYYTLKSQGISAGPGALTTFKLKKRVIKRLPHPYPDDCMSEGKVNFQGGVKFKFYFEYSMDWCKLACIWKTQMGLCGYVAPQYKTIVKAIVDTRETHFSFSNSTDPDEMEKEKKCLWKAASIVDIRHKICNCKPFCYEEENEASVSNLRWPTANQAEIYLSKMKTGWPNSSSIQNWTTQSIYKNLVKIELYFQDFRIETIEQKPAYGWNEFLSDLGGQVGLWIGASVYSIFELLSLLFLLVKKVFGLSGRKKEQICLEKPETKNNNSS